MAQTSEFISDLAELRCLYSMGELRLIDLDQLIRKHQLDSELAKSQTESTATEQEQA